MSDEGAAGTADSTRPTVGHVMHAYLADTETFVQNQIEQLHRYRPVVVAHHRRPAGHFRFQEGAIAQEALPPAVARAEALAYRVGKVALPSGVATLSRYLLDQEARLLHFHYVTDARFLLGVQRRTGLPSVVSGYGYDVSSAPRRFGGLGRAYLQPVFARVDRVLAMSEDMRHDLLALGCPESKVTVHYYGSDTRRFRHPGRSYAGVSGGPVVLCCGRLDPGKGQDLVLRALRQVEQRHGTPFRVVLVGDGSSRSRLEALVEEYGWQHRVRFCGHVPYTSRELVRHFHAADVFAHPSITVRGLKEGIPGTIVEAMASGLPVAATRHAGIPAVVEHERDGLLVEEHDVSGLADALQALLSDAALRERLGRAAAQRASCELDLRTRTRALERIYDGVL